MLDKKRIQSGGFSSSSLLLSSLDELSLFLVNVVEGDNVGGVKGFDDGLSVQPAMLALEKQIRGSLSKVAGQNGFPSWYY